MHKYHYIGACVCTNSLLELHISNFYSSTGGNSNEVLQRVDVYIQDNMECNLGLSQFTNRIDEVNENMVCAGHTRGAKDSCNVSFLSW